MTGVSQHSTFFQQVLAFWRWVKLAFGVAIVLFSILLLAQAWSVVRMGYDVHPVLGVLTAVVMASAVGFLIGVPIRKYFSTPRIIEPPKYNEADGVQAADVRKVVDFLDRSLVHALKNPHLTETHAFVETSRTKLTEFRSRAWAISDAAAPALDLELSSWADAQFSAIWRPVELKAERIIYQEALTVGLATAVSPNGTLDAYLMLWRSANLVGEISTLYYGRPGLFGTLSICRDVATAVAVAGTIQSVTDSLGNIAVHSIGGVAGILAGPVTEGITNALVLTRIGYLAEARCRGYRPWTSRQQKSALLGALSATKKVALGLSGEIVRKAGVGLGAMAGAAASSMAAAAGSAAGRVADAAGVAVESAAHWSAMLKAKWFTDQQATTGK